MSKIETLGGERKGGIAGFLKRFNKISAAVLLSAGVVLQSGVLIGLGLFDAAQSYALGRYEKWRDRRKAQKGLGRVAIAGA